MRHYYKGFEIVKDNVGISPWSIYERIFSVGELSLIDELVGHGTSLQNCKEQIDYRYYEEEA